MEVTIRADSVEITGYVNAVERKSKPLRSRIGQFVERICKGAFQRAIERNDDVRLLLNHNWQRDLGGTKDGNLTLTEDSIGLRAHATIRDADVIAKARNGELVGWSFGFMDRDVDQHDENGMPTRDVKDMDLFEVSILDKSRTPAYDGTLVSVRSDEEIQNLGEPLYSDVAIRVEEPEPEPDPTGDDKPIDYSKAENIIKEMKGDTNNV